MTGTNVAGGTVTFRIDGFSQASDFDLRVYESDDTGAPFGKSTSPTGDNEGTSPLGGNDPRNTGAGDYETTEMPVDGYVDENGDLDRLLPHPGAVLHGRQRLVHGPRHAGDHAAGPVAPTSRRARPPRPRPTPLV